jgi:hypothetical protein
MESGAIVLKKKIALCRSVIVGGSAPIVNIELISSLKSQVFFQYTNPTKKHKNKPIGGASI